MDAGLAGGVASPGPVMRHEGCQPHPVLENLPPPPHPRVHRSPAGPRTRTASHRVGSVATLQDPAPPEAAPHPPGSSSSMGQNP